MKYTIKKNQPIVVKIGSGVICDDAGKIALKRLKHLIGELAKLVKVGYRICLVSSGAISAGMGVRKLTHRTKILEKKQALAAVGQVEMMSMYQAEFRKNAVDIAQVLLTHEGLAHREGFVNARSTLAQLLKMGVLPIINENDTVSTREIQFGDNDQLAVLVANLVEAEEVVILSTAPGLLNVDEEGSPLIPLVEEIDERVLSLAKGAASLWGSGGMGSKLLAIQALNRAGKRAWLIDGRQKGVVGDVFSGKNVGTHFVAKKVKVSSKKQWMTQHLNPTGKIHVDAGAVKALEKRSASLLSAGIRGTDAQWKAGQLVSICFEGREIARGMSRLSSAQVEKVLGKSSKEVSGILGEGAPKFVVHRDDIVLMN